MQTNTKQFDPTKPVQTRDGRKVRILATDLKQPDNPICAVITEPSGYEFPYAYPLDGRSCKSKASDLINIPTKREGWVNLYRWTPGDTVAACTSSAFLTESDANSHAFSDRIACVRIEWEEA